MRKKPSLRVGQKWTFNGTVVQVVGWGQVGVGDGIVRFVSVPSDGELISMFGKSFQLMYDYVVPGRMMG